MPDKDITVPQRLLAAARWTGRGLRRLGVALAIFGRALWNPEFARTCTSGPAVARPTTTLPPNLDQTPPDGALLLLGLLQKEARFVDFLRQDVRDFTDQDVGAAARVVHQGCRRVLDDWFTIAPIRREPEGGPVTLEPGFDPATVRLTGQVVGEPPFRGTLIHPGWRATAVRLPQVAGGHDLKVLAPAEVEL